MPKLRGWALATLVLVLLECRIVVGIPFVDLEPLRQLKR